MGGCPGGNAEWSSGGTDELPGIVRHAVQRTGATFPRLDPRFTSRGAARGVRREFAPARPFTTHWPSLCSSTYCIVIPAAGDLLPLA